MNYGQTCHAGTRIYVHEDVYDKFLDAYTKRMGRIAVGDNFDPKVDQGPQNSKMQYDKILGYIESGKQEGATVHLGGKVADVGSEGGYYIEPTIFTNVKPEMKVSDIAEREHSQVISEGSFIDVLIDHERRDLRPCGCSLEIQRGVRSSRFGKRYDIRPGCCHPHQGL